MKHIVQQLVFIEIFLAGILFWSMNPFTDLSQKQSERQLSKNSWLAFGEMRAHIEACGCNPLTDLGGIKRVYNAITKYREKSNPVIFVLGNMYDVREGVHKNNFVENFLDKLTPEAFLVNALDLGYLQSKAYLKKSIPYLLSNYSDSLVGVHESIKITDATIFGFVSPNSLENALTAAEFLEKSQNSFVENNVLLFAGDQTELETLLQSQKFQTIISANERLLHQQPDQLEVDQLGLLFRSTNVYRVPVFAQGLLLGEKFREESKIDALLQSLDTKNSVIGRKQESDLLEKKTYFVEWLTREYELASPMDSLYSIYQESQKNIYLSWAMERNQAQSKQQSRFVGAEECSSCHKNEYRIWKESNHAIAMKVLVEKSKDKDLDCISCHVVGFSEPDGYIDQQHKPDLAGVQCENCHGPAREHLDNPTIKPIVIGSKSSRDVCVSCHHTPHTTNFNFQEYWDKIKH